MVSTGQSESKRDLDQSWYELMRALGDGLCSPEQGFIQASRGLEGSGDRCWALPIALSFWMQKRYQECCDLLEQDDIHEACSNTFLYYNLLGMSVKHLIGGE